MTEVMVKGDSERADVVFGMEEGVRFLCAGVAPEAGSDGSKNALLVQASVAR
jgi:hypothetical protein